MKMKWTALLPLAVVFTGLLFQTPPFPVAVNRRERLWKSWPCTMPYSPGGSWRSPRSGEHPKRMYGFCSNYPPCGRGRLGRCHPNRTIRRGLRLPLRGGRRVSGVCLLPWGWRSLHRTLQPHEFSGRGHRRCSAAWGAHFPPDCHLGCPHELGRRQTGSPAQFWYFLNLAAETILTGRNR